MLRSIILDQKVPKVLLFDHDGFRQSPSLRRETVPLTPLIVFCWAVGDPRLSLFDKLAAADLLTVTRASTLAASVSVAPLPVFN